MPEEEVRLLRRVVVTGITACVDGGGEISRARNGWESAANGIRSTRVARPRVTLGSGKGNLSVRAALA